MSETYVTMIGNVCDEPVRRMTKSGEPMMTFRLASSVRRFDTSLGRYVDGSTNYLDVVAYRTLARHAADALHRGDPVMVHGRLKVESWSTETSSGINVEITAQHIGPDLSRAPARFDRSPVTSPVAGGPTPSRVPGLDPASAETDSYEIVRA